VLAIFNSLGGGEVIAILVIGLIVLGPDKLPDAIRKFGNIYGELRRMSHGFQSELRDAFDEPMQTLRGTAQVMQDSVNEPLSSITELKAPVVGGGAAANGSATADDADTGAADPTATAEDEGTTAETNATADAPATAESSTEHPVTHGEEVQAAVDDDEDGEPVLAEAGLLVSEPEMPTDAASDEERPG
jgi:sec-independent protein translocase protein TatB